MRWWRIGSREPDRSGDRSGEPHAPKHRRGDDAPEEEGPDERNDET